MRSIKQKQFEGEFYTPLPFAKLALEYMSDILEGDFRIWDMAAGVGNLEHYIPSEYHKYLYLSTLHQSDVDILKDKFPDSTSFCYDYLNNTHDELPQKLRDDLANDNIKWIVYINPPYGTSQDKARNKESKKGISDTSVNKEIGKGHAKRELYIQFIYRLINEMPKNTHLCIFSTLKYLVSPDSIDFRNEYFNFKYEGGFIFSSTNFDNIKGKFPVGFLMWDLSKKRDSIAINIDIINDECIKEDTKQLRLLNKEDLLNNWCDRPANSKDFIMPPLSNGITVIHKGVDVRNKTCPNFLASFMCAGNDLQHQAKTCLLSSPYVSAGAYSITHENFEKSMIIHAVRKIVKATWMNDRDQFLIPNLELDREFINDCIIWSLFSNSNETASLKDVKYDDKIYQIKNNFYPFYLSNQEDTYVFNWIKDNIFSTESSEILKQAKIIYNLFHTNKHNMNLHKYKIETLDVGWYQIRNVLKDVNIGIEELSKLKKLHDKLNNKLLPIIYKYNFL